LACHADRLAVEGKEEDVVAAVERAHTPRKAALLIAMMASRLDPNWAAELVHILAAPALRLKW
jgi:predicted NAD-dependent protein-ADP-ribosyltransferase YbiA (DUF1768 family)